MFGNGKLLATGLLLLSLCATGLAQDSFVSFEAGSQGFCIAAQGNAAPIVAAAQEDVGVRRAAADLVADIHRVTGITSRLQTGMD
ncbi:MAG TPA: hypothetical protein VHH88_05460, partial [Verrucomicrobiae bacterium]|nr:hypothetical protein [Verrucomicrobiae bacterium]